MTRTRARSIPMDSEVGLGVALACLVVAILLDISASRDDERKHDGQ